MSGARALRAEVLAALVSPAPAVRRRGSVVVVVAVVWFAVGRLFQRRAGMALEVGELPEVRRGRAARGF